MGARDRKGPPTVGPGYLAMTQDSVMEVRSDLPVLCANCARAVGAHSPDVLAVVADALNTRPRKTLGWRTPAEALDQCLQASQTERVATTG